MAYQLISNPASPSAVVQAIGDFLSVNGWTIERTGNVGGERELLIRTNHNPGDGARDYRYTLFSNTTGELSWIRVAGRTGYSGAAAWDAQPGHVAGPATSLRHTTMSRLWMFAGSGYCHFVIEVQPGYFSSGHIGVLEMAFAPGAAALTGQFQCSGVANISGRWSQLANTPSGNLPPLVGMSSTYKSGLRLRLDTVSGAAWSGNSAPTWRSDTYQANTNIVPLQSPKSPVVLWPRPDGSRPLMPVNIYGQHDPAQSINHFLYGTIPAFRSLYFHDLAPATEFNLGGDIWMAFPVLGHNRTVQPILGNREFGMAIYKETV